MGHLLLLYKTEDALSQSTQYDVAIIGSGPGGYVAAIRAGQLGLRTVIVEKEKAMGGTCLNWGCIPTKALLHDAEVFQLVKNAATYGVKVGGAIELDLAQAHRHKDKIVLKNGKGIEYLMAKHKVEVVRGFGSLEGPGRIVVKGGDGAERKLEAKNVLLAMGSSVRELPTMPFDGKVILSSDQILGLREVPEHLVVVGAGAVGVEFASIWSRFGAKVTLVELLDRIVPLEDADVSNALAKAFKKQGMTIHTGAKVEMAVAGKVGVTVSLKLADGKSEELAASHLLVAVGRKPNTDRCGLENTQVKMERGYVKVDPFMRTDEPHVYAIGDIVPTPMLAHVASSEGKLAVEHMAGQEVVPINYDHVPSCTYCEPQVASVGLTEDEAKRRGYDVRVGRFNTSVLAKAQIVGDADGFVKIVAEKKYGELLGFHIYGHLATELLSEATVALHLEETDEDFARVMHPHPTLAEAVHEAGLSILGHPIHG